MTLLHDSEIADRCRLVSAHPPLVSPFCNRTVANGMTYGLGPAGYDVRIDQEVRIVSRGFVLASTIERFHMPVDLAARVHDKSSWVRLGLTVQNTFLEPGWRGYLTLELINHGDLTLLIPRGAPIAMVAFERLTGPAFSPYQGKYQDQGRGPQPSLHEPDG